MQQDTLSHQYNNFDVKMSFKIKTIDTTTVIDGIFRNIRYALMEDIEIRVVLLDGRGNTVCRTVEFVVPGRLDMDETATFSLVLPTVVPHGSKLVFTYSYCGCDGGDGTKWMQSFETLSP